MSEKLMRQVAQIQEMERLKLQKILNDGEKMRTKIPTGSVCSQKNQHAIVVDTEKYRQQTTLFM